MLLPLLAGLKIISICESPEGMLVHVPSTHRRAIYPLCSKPSRHVHNHYSRSSADLPSIGRPVRLLSIRRFFCEVASCPRKIFTERLLEELVPSSRLTTCLRTTLRQIGFAVVAKLAND